MHGWLSKNTQEPSWSRTKAKKVVRWMTVNGARVQGSALSKPNHPNDKFGLPQADLSQAMITSVL